MLSTLLPVLAALFAAQFPEKPTEQAAGAGGAEDRIAVALARNNLPRPSTETESRPARPGMYFDAVGERSFLCGTEDGPFEAWIWPFQLFHGGRFRFRPHDALEATDVHRTASRIRVEPHATTVEMSSADLFLGALYTCLDDRPGIVILLEADLDAQGELSFSFQPRLQPQWPASLGGVAAAFDEALGAYVISEPSGRAAAVVGSPWAARAARGMQYLLPDGALRIDLPLDPARCQRECIPIVAVAEEGTDAVPRARQAYRALVSEAAEAVARQRDRWAARVQGLTRLRAASDPELERAFLWNAISLQQGLVRSAALGDGVVAGYGPAGATSGRPGFAWFFTGDLSVNAPAYLSAGLEETLEVGLRFAARHQRADGKIPHEVVLSAHRCKWFEDYPFAYIHGETTGLWILACAQYLDQTGNRRFLEDLWPAIRQGYGWILAQDGDGDGLPDNDRAGMGASEIGELRRQLRTDVYLASASAAALEQVSRLAVILGEADLAREARTHFERAQRSLGDSFWDDAEKSYAHALLTNGAISKERTVWPAYAVATGLLEGRRALETMARIGEPDLTTSWGVRFLSARSAHFDPKGYNQGCVWPFVTGIAALGDFRVGRGDAGYGKVRSVVEWTFAEALARTPEVISGARPRSLDASVPHQLFSSMAVVAPAVRGLLGYEPDAFSDRITFRPCFPLTWRDARVEAEGLRFRGRRFDAVVERKGSTYSLQTRFEGTPPRDVELAPREAPVR